MKCPRCPNSEVRLRDKVCARCGTPTTVNAMLGEASHWVRTQRRRWTTVRCPSCGQGVSMRLRTCPCCESDLTVGTALTEMLQPAGERGRHLISHPPSTVKRIVQWAYFLGSITLVGGQLASLERIDGLQLLLLALVAVPYLVALLFLLMWIGPQPWQRRLAKQSSAMVKLGLLLNYFSIVLLGQQIFETHWKASLILGGVLLVGWTAVHLFTEGLWPLMLRLGAIFRWNEAGSFDPSQPQGRKGHYR